MLSHVANLSEANGPAAIIQNGCADGGSVTSPISKVIFGCSNIRLLTRRENLPLSTARAEPARKKVLLLKYHELC